MYYFYPLEDITLNKLNMRWRGRRQSQNVEDHRSGGGRTGRRVAVGGGIGTIIIFIIALLLGENPMQLLQQSGTNPGFQQEQRQYESSAPEDELGQFASVVLAETEDVWSKLFREQLGKTYRPTTLVLFKGQDRSACGFASAATGPFYCPGDEKVYIDLIFYDELKRKFNAPGDFALAYVLAHEVGHHIQNQLGISGQVHKARGQVSKAEYNDLSVRLELQADFLAGVWAHHADKANNILERGDIEEALNAANAIGDDRLQKQAQGYVIPDSFTHGTSAQRMRWFTLGYETGDMNQGDTFNARRL